MTHSSIVLALILLAQASPLEAAPEVKPSAEAGLPPLQSTHIRYSSEQQEARALGIALAPSVDEIAALSSEQREQQASAIKYTQLIQRLIQKENKSPRLSQEQWAECAQLAAQLGAPASYIANLKYRVAHEEPYSARVYYLLRQSLSDTLHRYRIEDVHISLFIKRNVVSLPELRKIFAAEGFPWAQVFNYPTAKLDKKGQPLDSSQMELHARSTRLETSLNALLAAYRSITDATTAEAAVELIRPHLSSYGEIALIFNGGDPALAAYYTQHPKRAELMIESLKSLHQLREELRAKYFYKSSTMQATDQLIL